MPAMESNTAPTDQMKISAKIVSLHHQATLLPSFENLNYLQINENGWVCFIVDSARKSNPASKHGPDTQTEAEAQTPAEIQLEESPKSEQHLHYDFSSPGAAYDSSNGSSNVKFIVSLFLTLSRCSFKCFEEC